MDKLEKKERNRPDHDGAHRSAFDRAKKKILASESVCGICGLPVDKTLKYPHPLAPCIDHIIPIDRGGHPSDIANLQLAHWKCNRAKSNKLVFPLAFPAAGNKSNPHDGNEMLSVSNRNLPLSFDWSQYHGKG